MKAIIVLSLIALTLAVVPTTKVPRQTNTKPLEAKLDTTVASQVKLQAEIAREELLVAKVKKGLTKLETDENSLNGLLEGLKKFTSVVVETKKDAKPLANSNKGARISWAPAQQTEAKTEVKADEPGSSKSPKSSAHKNAAANKLIANAKFAKAKSVTLIKNANDIITGATEDINTFKARAHPPGTAPEEALLKTAELNNLIAQGKVRTVAKKEYKTKKTQRDTSNLTDELEKLRAQTQHAIDDLTEDQRALNEVIEELAQLRKKARFRYNNLEGLVKEVKAE